MAREYLGDGAYIDYDGFNVILTTSNGIEDTNEIYLEPIVLENFLTYAIVHSERFKKIVKAAGKVINNVETATNIKAQGPSEEPPV